MYKIWLWYEGEYDFRSYRTAKTLAEARYIANEYQSRGASIEIENKQGDIVYYNYQ